MASKRILVIDDVSVIRGFVKAALRDLDVDVAEASEGAQALEMHNALPADLIICDINMPGVNGEGVLRALRENGDATPVIILSAEGDKAVVGNLLKLGIQGYLLKPFKPGVLNDRVQELFSGNAPVAPAPAQDEGDATAAASPGKPEADSETALQSDAAGDDANEHANEGAGEHQNEGDAVDTDAADPHAAAG